jgi:hypothetical protein
MDIIYSETNKRFELPQGYLGKYINDSNDVIEGIFKYCKIRFTQPGALNDPLEFNPIIKIKSTDNIDDNYFYKGEQLLTTRGFTYKTLIDVCLNTNGILSLTNIPDSFNMWNMYSNGHKGCFLIFNKDFNNHKCMMNPNQESSLIEKVIYKNEYVVELDNIITIKNYHEEFSKIYKEIFYCKTSRWNNENEYRIVRDLTSHPYFDKNTNNSKIYLFDFSLECIKGVVLGSHMLKENKSKIRKYCENYSIDFFQEVITKDEIDYENKMGKVVIFKIGDCDLPWRYIETENNPIILDVASEKNKNKDINIKSLEELPYYNGNEDIVRLIYKSIL